MDDGNSKTTRLLTLLNVSAVKLGKRKRTYDDKDLQPSVKLNKRKPDPNPVEQEKENEEVDNTEDLVMEDPQENEEIRVEGVVHSMVTYQKL
jgi:U3 small nucleolar RNA-associated protein 25